MKTKCKDVLFAIIVVFVGALCVRPAVLNSQSLTRKTWDFKDQQGIVRIELIIDPSSPTIPSLGILYENGAHPSLSEESGFIRDVLRQLPGLGVDPHNLRSVSMPGFAEPEVAQRVANAALHSEAWQSFTTVRGGAERVVKDLLNSLGAYDGFNAAFEEYGLRVTVGAIEKVSSAKCLDLKISDPLCSIHHNVRVPTGANVYLDIEKTVGSHGKATR